MPMPEPVKRTLRAAIRQRLPADATARCMRAFYRAGRTHRPALPALLAALADEGVSARDIDAIRETYHDAARRYRRWGIARRAIIWREQAIARIGASTDSDSDSEEYREVRARIARVEDLIEHLDEFLDGTWSFRMQ